MTLISKPVGGRDEESRIGTTIKPSVKSGETL